MAEKFVDKDVDKQTEEADTDNEKTANVKAKKGSPKSKKTTKSKKSQDREFDWPKKNYFQVTCVAAESNGSVQRMVNVAAVVCLHCSQD